MIEEELLKAGSGSDRQHVNLFRQEQISEMIKEKRQEREMGTINGH
jgi:hypothetical protein